MGFKYLCMCFVCCKFLVIVIISMHVCSSKIPTLNKVNTKKLWLKVTNSHGMLVVTLNTVAKAASCLDYIILDLLWILRA